MGASDDSAAKSKAVPPALPARAKKRRSPWRVWLIIFSLLLLIGAAAILTLAVRHSRLSAGINGRLASIRALHEPVSLTELNKYYAEVPQPSNAAVLYGNAFKIVRQSKELKKLEHADELPSGSESLPRDLQETMQQAVTENQDALKVLDSASNFLSCRYPVDYSHGWQTLLPHLKDLPNLTRLYLYRGTIEEQLGHADVAIDSVKAILQISASLDPEPDMISLVVQSKIRFHAIELLRWVLNHRQLTESQLIGLQELFSEEGNDRLQKAAIGERCMILAVYGYGPTDVLRLIDPSAGDNLMAILGMHVYEITGMLKEDEIYYLDQMIEARRMLQLPFPERLERAEEISEEAKNNILSKREIVGGFSITSFLKFVGRATQSVARQRLARTALGIERYRLAKGELPAVLVDLAPNYLLDVPIDPFDGEPLRYKKQVHGFVVCSIGPDGEDDGGVKPISPHAIAEKPRGDIILTVSR
jgi:hypothetical protein